MLLSAVSLLVAIVAIEVTLRVVGLTPQIGRRGVRHRLFCEYDSLLGWRNIPNMGGWHATDEYKVFEKLNSKGIRGPEFSYNKEAGVYRILVLGDSFAEGYMVPLESRFSEVMERELTGEGTSVQVINMGTGGYSTDQELLRFESEGCKYHPDIVVLMFYSNDVWYNAQDRSWCGLKPMFKIETSELRLTNVPVPRLNESGDTVIDRERSRFSELMKWPRENLRFYTLVTRGMKSMHWSRSIATKLGMIYGGIPEYFMIWRRERSPEVHQAWNITEAILLRLRESIERSGGDLIVFYVPDNALIYAQSWVAMKRMYGISDRDWSIEQVGRDLERVCRQHAIPFIDPTNRFKEVASELRSSDERLYYKKDVHWNVNGHRLAGEILAEYIKEYWERE